MNESTSGYTNLYYRDEVVNDRFPLLGETIFQFEIQDGYLLGFLNHTWDDCTICIVALNQKFEVLEMHTSPDLTDSLSPSLGKVLDETPSEIFVEFGKRGVLGIKIDSRTRRNFASFFERIRTGWLWVDELRSMYSGVRIRLSVKAR